MRNWKGGQHTIKFLIKRRNTCRHFQLLPSAPVLHRHLCAFKPRHTQLMKIRESQFRMLHNMLVWYLH